MVQFKDCTYYQVTSEDRESHVRNITQEKAEELMFQLQEEA